MTDPASRAPVYLNYLDLANVRCFGERQRLRLTDENGNPARWILLLGDNGVGKTTLLQCLAWMRPDLAPGEDQKIPEPGEKMTAIEPALNRELEENLNSLIRIAADGGSTIEVPLEASFSIGRRLGGGEPGEGTQPGEIVTGILLRGKNGKLEDLTLTKNVPPERPDVLRSELPMFAYGATRGTGTLKLDRRELGAGLSDPLASLFVSSTELYDAEDVLLKLDHRARVSGEEQDRRRLQHIIGILASVLPGIERDEDIEILGPAVFGSEPSGVRFRTPYAPVPLSGLSLGYQTTLTWIVDLALRLQARYPESVEPLSEPGIVLVDNIDLHLHPRWQRRLMDDLSRFFPAVQFVASAHSPLIVQAARRANLVVLRESEGQVVIEDGPMSVNAWRADQILSSDLFGVPVHGPPFDALKRERDDLLDKLDRSRREEERLRSIEEQLETLPTAEGPRDRDQAAMDLIRRVADRLKEHDRRP